MNIYKKMSMILLVLCSLLYAITTSAVSHNTEESSQQSAIGLRRARPKNDCILMTPQQIQDDWNKGLLIETIQKAANNLSQSLSQLKTDSLDHCHSLYALGVDTFRSLESVQSIGDIHSHNKKSQNPLKIIHDFISFRNFLNNIKTELFKNQGDFTQNDTRYKRLLSPCIKAIDESLGVTKDELTCLFEWLAQDNENSLLLNEHKSKVRELLNKDKEDLNIYSFLEKLTTQYDKKKNHADDEFLSDYNNPYWHLENNVMVSPRSEDMPSHRAVDEEIERQDPDNLHLENNVMVSPRSENISLDESFVDEEIERQDPDNLHLENMVSPRSEDISLDESFVDEEIERQDPDNLHLENSAIVSFRPENMPSHRAVDEEIREITTIDDGLLADYKVPMAKTLVAFKERVPTIQNALSNLHVHLDGIK